MVRDERAEPECQGHKAGQESSVVEFPLLPPPSPLPSPLSPSSFPLPFSLLPLFYMKEDTPMTRELGGQG